MQQQPQNKIKPTDQLNALLVQQTDRLRARGRQILDILDDIRYFGKQRSALEQQHAEALLKLTQQLLSKKDLFPSSSVRVDNDTKKRTINSAWRSILEETQTLAWHRRKASNTYTDQVCEPSRLLRERIAAVFKQGMEQLKTLQDDLTQTTKEMAERYKQHALDEAASADSLTKLNAEEERSLKSPRSSNLNLLKVRERRDACATKAAHTRNSYLLEWAAANAHYHHYQNAQLPDLYEVLDQDMFGSVSSIMSSLAKVEQDLCTATSQMHMKLQEYADMADHSFDLQCFVDGAPELTEHLVFDSLATCNGQVTAALTTSHGEKQHLNQEARKWAAKVAREQKQEQKLNAAVPAAPDPYYIPMTDADRSGKKGKPTVPGQPLPEAINSIDLSELDKLKVNKQKSLSGKCKALARLELIRSTDIVDIDALLSEACSEQQPPGGLLKADPDGSDTSSLESGSGPSGGSLPSAHKTWDIDTSSASSSAVRGSTANDVFPYNVRVLFPHEPRVPDELCLIAGDILVVLQHAEDDGWVKARDSHGNEGLLPLTYVTRLVNTSMADQYDGSVSGPNSRDSEECYEMLPDPQVSTDTTYYLEPEQIRPLIPTNKPASPALRRPPKPAPRPPSVALPCSPLAVNDHTYESGPECAVWLRALVDYTALTDEELSFSQGECIRLVNKRSDDSCIDDGFWQGQLHNGRMGLFPSFIVEEIENVPAESQVTDPDFLAHR